MNIILLDSGIDVDRFSINGGINFVDSDKKNIRDDNGHGSYSAEIISQINPDVNFYVLKILNENAEGSIDNLVNALEMISENEIEGNLICMSLSFSNTNYKNKLEKICQKLVDKHKILVAATDNNQNNIGIPARLKGVIGVNGIVMNKEAHWFNKGQEIQYVGDITPRFIRKKSGVYTMFGGNSKVTAELIGKLSLVYDKNWTYDEVCFYLDRTAIRQQWSKTDINEGRQINSKNFKVGEMSANKDMLAQIAGLVSAYLEIEKEKLLLDILHKYLGPDDYYYILEVLQRKIGVHLNYEKVNFNNFNSVYTLSELILTEITKK
jgi:hypothetical protein